MTTVPVGFLVTGALAAWCTLLALTPLRRPFALGAMSFFFGFVLNELPFVAFYYLLASTLLATGQGGVDSPGGWAAVGLAVLAAAGLVVVAWRGLRAGPAAANALSVGLGAGWRTAVDAGMAARLRRRLPLARIVFGPFFFRRRDVERVANISYGDAGRKNLLDLYRHRSQPPGAPILVHLHGGALFMGKKNREALPLLYRLASQGWVCISANYRLSPAARFPDHLIDVKKVIAWVREHGHEYAADPAVVFVAGSSAGGQLAALAALTPSDPAFQPGFGHADTSVTAAICLHGYYGHPDTKERSPSSPLAHDGTGAPPFFVAHGDQDTLVPVDAARLFVERLRTASSNAVVYAELPGGQHGFDRFHSLRFDQVVDAIEAFAAWVRSREQAPKA
jgi:acetyl esterase/lipase